MVSPHQRAVIVVECVNEDLALKRGIGTPEDVDTAVRYGFGFRYIAAGPILQKARYEAALKRGLAILRADDENN